MIVSTKGPLAAEILFCAFKSACDPLNKTLLVMMSILQNLLGLEATYLIEQKMVYLGSFVQWRL